MAKVIDFSGPRLDLRIRRGTTAAEAYSDIEDSSGTAITTISVARITFRAGAITDTTPGTAVASLTVTPTNTGSTISWEMTPTQTRLFTAGTAYWYQVEFDTADGKTWTLLVGNVTVEMEGVT